LRKATLAALTGVLFFALAALAWALSDNQVEYDSTVATKGKVPKGQPKNIEYNGILEISTGSGGQPNVAPLTEIFFAKELKNNSQKFPACDTEDIDGKPADEFPAKCNKAVVGDGTAAAAVGTPGEQPLGRQGLKVTAVNGNGGDDIMLVLINDENGGAVTNYRVIPGHIQKLSGDPDFGYKVGFEVPEELQEQLGAQISLTNFDVKIKANKKVKVPYGKKPKKKGKKRKKYAASYLQLKKCPTDGNLPVKAIVHFNDDSNQPGGQTVEDTSESSCG
jgi:hypothetical protein